MKPDARAAERMLADPAALRAILLHGDDPGLIRERASLAARAAAGTLDDPFRLAVLGPESHDRLAEEATALSMSGGRRVVWVREAKDAIAASLGRILAAPARADAALVVIEAPGLASRGKLRGLAEGAPAAAAIACYAESGRALEISIARMLQADRVQIEADALSWLAARLGADRAVSRGEVEKLSLYVGPGGRIRLEDVQAVSGDAAQASLEDTAFAALAGDREAADLAVERTLADGASPVGLARALLSHVHRLRQVLLMQEDGMSQSDAMARLRPPVFFKRREAFVRTLSVWHAEGLAEAAAETSDLELACKRTGAPDHVLARRHVSMLAGRAHAARLRTGIGRPGGGPSGARSSSLPRPGLPAASERL